MGNYEECEDCVCLKCKGKRKYNCCELCKLKGYGTPNYYCDNDDLINKEE